MKTYSIIATHKKSGQKYHRTIRLSNPDAGVTEAADEFLKALHIVLGWSHTDIDTLSLDLMEE